jgi:hypothetical protein
MVKLPFEKKKQIPKIDIEKLIDKGAPLKEDIRDEDSKKCIHINLRIPIDMLKEIDKTVDNKVGISRTGWILQTLHRELKRNQQNKQE